MMRTLLSLSLLCALAAPATARVDEGRLALLVSIICDKGGAMDTSEAAHILPAQGFNMQETQTIVAELENREQVVATAGMATLQLTKEACQ